MVALFVVGLIAFLVLMDVGVRYVYSRKHVPSAPPQVVRRPADIVLSPNHLWLRVLPSGEVMVGVDELLGRLVDRVDGVILPQAGQLVRKGKECLAVLFGDRVVHFSLPVEAVITFTNPGMSRKVKGLVNDPYNTWLFTMRPLNSSGNACFFQKTIRGKEAGNWLDGEISSGVDFLKSMARVPVRGFQQVPANTLLTDIPPQVVKAFEEQFLIKA